MGDDDIYKNRDLMLGEIHASAKNTEKTLGEIKQWCIKHDKKDDNRFFWGALAIIVVAFYAGVLPQLLKIVHIG